MSGASSGASGGPRQIGDRVAAALAAELAADRPAEGKDAPPSAADVTRDATRFAHASEAEMARILDFYAVRWEYEPTTFPILWNLEGEVVESFAPDFYLPELEVFLEMTTLKQRLVRKKNRKLRRLRELYPDIRIKLFYARDFRAMMLKYGRFGLFESLSGTPGQVMHVRAAIEGVAPVAAALAAAALLAADPADAAAAADPAVPLPADLSAVPPIPRATPRSRASRRRRAAGLGIETGAEHEAGT